MELSPLSSGCLKRSLHLDLLRTLIPCHPEVHPCGQPSALARSCWRPQRDITQSEQHSGCGGWLSVHGLLAGPGNSQPHCASHSPCSSATIPEPGLAQHLLQLLPLPGEQSHCFPRGSLLLLWEAVSQRAHALLPSLPRSPETIVIKS